MHGAESKELAKFGRYIGHICGKTGFQNLMKIYTNFEMHDSNRVLERSQKYNSTDSAIMQRKFIVISTVTQN